MSLNKGHNKNLGCSALKALVHKGYVTWLRYGFVCACFYLYEVLVFGGFLLMFSSGVWFIFCLYIHWESSKISLQQAIKEIGEERKIILPFFSDFQVVFRRSILLSTLDLAVKLRLISTKNCNLRFSILSTKKETY